MNWLPDCSALHTPGSLTDYPEVINCMQNNMNTTVNLAIIGIALAAIFVTIGWLMNRRTKGGKVKVEVQKEA